MQSMVSNSEGTFSKLGLSEEEEVHRRVRAVLLWLAM
jgi:hypothetical protein